MAKYLPLLTNAQIEKIKKELKSYYRPTGHRKIVISPGLNPCHVWQVVHRTAEEKMKRNKNRKAKLGLCEEEEDDDDDEEEKTKRRRKRKPNPYPQYFISDRRQRVNAHILTYFLEYRITATWPEVISHLCHNRFCSNIDHLNFETQADNNSRKKCNKKKVCEGHGSLPDCVFPAGS